jgi:predicted protein tyrosine phosphatase
MTEVFPNLFVGHQGDFEYQVKGKEGWAVVHACKEPYHRELLGYKGRGAPKDHPEYLVAVRGDRLYLNLVDVDDPAYIHEELVEAAIGFIREKLESGKKVLVHCNQGESRGPAIAFLYLLRHTAVLPKTSLDAALEAFRRMYPAFHPSAGIAGYIAAHWND